MRETGFQQHWAAWAALVVIIYWLEPCWLVKSKSSVLAFFSNETMSREIRYIMGQTYYFLLGFIPDEPVMPIIQRSLLPIFFHFGFDFVRYRHLSISVFDVGNADEFQQSSSDTIVWLGWILYADSTVCWLLIGTSRLPLLTSHMKRSKHCPNSNFDQSNSYCRARVA